MQKGKKIRLLPTLEQEILFWKSAGIARWAYNYFLSENEELYQEYLKNGQRGKTYVSGNEIRKQINHELKNTTHSWLKEVGSNVIKQAVKDAEKAFLDFLSGKRGKPHYKSRKSSKISFYVNYETLKRVAGGFRKEKLGLVKTRQALPKLHKDGKYSNPRISYDGKFWYISVGYLVQGKQEKLTEERIGIDLGIKNLAVCFNGKVYKNINQSKKVKRLKKKLKREQRKLSRKIERNIIGYKEKREPMYKKLFRQFRNIEKQTNKVRLIYKKIRDIRMNYLHQTTTEIVKTKPSRIVLESLNVRGMMKNRHLSRAIGEQGFYEFKRQIAYKSEFYGIELVYANKFYASSKACSKCGNIKKDLKLSDRVYCCGICGLVIDRDFNASLNLANYESA